MSDIDRPLACIHAEMELLDAIELILRGIESSMRRERGESS